MSKGKKALAIILTIWGSIMTLIGVFLLVIWADMTIDEIVRKGDLEAYLVLGTIILVIAGIIGVFPLAAGVKMLRGKFRTSK